MAAKSELEDMDSSESARHLFLRALRFHPEDKKVFQEVDRNLNNLDFTVNGKCFLKLYSHFNN